MSLREIAYSEKTAGVNNSVEDYSTLEDYHSTFYDALKNWKITQSRLAIVPGGYKYLNNVLYSGYDNLPKGDTEKAEDSSDYVVLKN